MKLTRKKLRQLIIETMITPSSLLQRILQDNQVDPRIKSQLQSAINDGNHSSINQLLQYVAALYPEYIDEIDTTATDIMMPDYQEKFDKETVLGRTSTIEGVERVITDILDPYRSQIIPDFTLIFDPNFKAGFALHILSTDLDILQQIEASAAAKGIKTWPIVYEMLTMMDYQLERRRHNLRLMFDDHIYKPRWPSIEKLTRFVDNYEKTFRKT